MVRVDFIIGEAECKFSFNHKVHGAGTQDAKSLVSD